MSPKATEGGAAREAPTFLRFEGVSALRFLSGTPPSALPGISPQEGIGYLPNVYVTVAWPSAELFAATETISGKGLAGTRSVFSPSA